MAIGGSLATPKAKLKKKKKKKEEIFWPAGVVLPFLNFYLFFKY
jgi:hypothetical protein